jgi:hypothetical protein
MEAVIAGRIARRPVWGVRRGVRLARAPWNGAEEALLMGDLLKRGDVPDYPYAPSGADVRATDWVALEPGKEGK